jgi:hypothetical protein
MRIRIKVFLGCLTLLGENSGEIHLCEVSLRRLRENSGTGREFRENKAKRLFVAK